MKYLVIIVFAALITYGLQNCTNQSSNNYEKKDTSFTAIMYWTSFSLDNYTVSTAKRFIITHKIVDTTKMEKSWVTDTAYLVPVKIPVKDSATQKDKIDSFGKVIYNIQLAQLPKELFLYDFDKKYKFK